MKTEHVKSLPILGVCRRIPSSARERAVFRLASTAKQVISVYIVDAAGRSPVGQQAVRSQIGFSDRLLALWARRKSGITHQCTVWATKFAGAGAISVMNYGANG